MRPCRVDYPALTPGTSPSGAPLINPIFLNFFSPRRAAASLSLSRRWGWRLMMMVVAAVMKPSCLASLRALKKVTLGDGGEEESRAARSAVSMFAVCVSTWARAAAPTERHALTEGERERERPRGREVGGGLSVWKLHLPSAVQIYSAVFSSASSGWRETRQKRNEDETK